MRGKKKKKKRGVRVRLTVRPPPERNVGGARGEVGLIGEGVPLPQRVTGEADRGPVLPEPAVSYRGKTVNNDVPQAHARDISRT